jgi:hypothetical protein
MDINPENETSYTTEYLEVLLKFVELECCAKYRRVAGNKLESLPSSKLIPSATDLGFSQSSFDPCDLSSEDEEYLMSVNVAETTPGRSDHAGC